MCGRAGLVAQVGRWWAAPLSQEPDGQRLPACSRLVEAGRARGTFSVWCLESAFGARGGARLLAVDPRGVERRVRIDREREGVDRLGEANRRGRSLFQRPASPACSAHVPRRARRRSGDCANSRSCSWEMQLSDSRAGGVGSCRESVPRRRRPSASRSQSWLWAASRPRRPGTVPWYNGIVPACSGCWLCARRTGLDAA